MKHSSYVFFFTAAVPLCLAGTTPVLRASEPVTPAHIKTIPMSADAVTTLHLRPGFESVIHLPEAVTSVILGNPNTFKAAHKDGEPEYVYVTPIVREAAQSNLMIATESGKHVMLELVSDDESAAEDTTPVDFMLEYRSKQDFLVSDVPAEPPAGRVATPLSGSPQVPVAETDASIQDGNGDQGAPAAALGHEYREQQQINAPPWTKWKKSVLETSVGAVRQWDNQVAVSFSVLNSSAHPIEIVPPQIQLAGLKLKQKKKKKKGLSVTADQLQVRDYRLSETRLGPGSRADGVVLFDRPNYKQSSQQLFLQVAEAGKIDQPLLVHLPFTPPIAGNAR